jgi:hypothetical protein
MIVMSIGLTASPRATNNKETHHFLNPSRNQKATGRSIEDDIAQKKSECLPENRPMNTKSTRTPPTIPSTFKDLSTMGTISELWHQVIDW